MLVISLMIAISYVEFHDMAMYGGTSVSRLEKGTRSSLIGPVNLESEVAIPFISFIYHGEDIFLDGTKSGQCKETDGDC